MKWSATLAAACLACGYVHYAFISQLGGNPALVVPWLVVFVAAASVAMKRSLDRL